MSDKKKPTGEKIAHAGFDYFTPHFFIEINHYISAKYIIDFAGKQEVFVKIDTFDVQMSSYFRTYPVLFSGKLEKMIWQDCGWSEIKPRLAIYTPMHDMK